MRISRVPVAHNMVTINPLYPSLPKSSQTGMRGSVANRCTRLSTSASVRTHVGFAMPEKMSSSTSLRADICPAG
jgi:hypothetical protein